MSAGGVVEIHPSAGSINPVVWMEAAMGSTNCDFLPKATHAYLFLTFYETPLNKR